MSRYKFIYVYSIDPCFSPSSPWKSAGPNIPHVLIRYSCKAVTRLQSRKHFTVVENLLYCSPPLWSLCCRWPHQKSYPRRRKRRTMLKSWCQRLKRIWQMKSYRICSLAPKKPEQTLWNWVVFSMPKSLVVSVWNMLKTWKRCSKSWLQI